MALFQNKGLKQSYFPVFQRWRVCASVDEIRPRQTRFLSFSKSHHLKAALVWKLLWFVCSVREKNAEGIVKPLMHEECLFLWNHCYIKNKDATTLKIVQMQFPECYIFYKIDELYFIPYSIQACCWRIASWENEPLLRVFLLLLEMFYFQCTGWVLCQVFRIVGANTLRQKRKHTHTQSSFRSSSFLFLLTFGLIYTVSL